MITVLAGGVGAARLLAGLVQVMDPSELAAVVNTGDDLVLHGLHISPDLDTVTYTLAGRQDPERGWGLAGETWTVMDQLAALGGDTWFRLGDRDLATHLFRTGRLAGGAPLHQVTAELAARLGVGATLLPMSDDPVRTMVALADGGEVAFQEYFVRLGHQVSVRGVRFDGAELARPAPGVLDALRHAERVVVAPSNPILSIAPVLAVPGVREVLAARVADVVAVSPLVGGAALKGPAARLLTELGYGASSAGVASYYQQLAATLVIDVSDADDRTGVERQGLRCVVAPTVMTDRAAAAGLGRAVLDA